MVSQHNGNVYGELVRAAKRKILLHAIREEGGNLSAAAISLGIHRNTMGRALRETGLSAAQVKRYLKEVVAA